MNHNLPHFSTNNEDNFADVVNKTENPLYSDAPINPEQTNSPERLPHPIHLYRTMSGVELWKFINHQEIAKEGIYSPKESSAITTAKPRDYHFSPSRAECHSEYPEDDTSLVSEDLPELDFEQVFKTWYLGDWANYDGAYSLSVEFSTNVHPDVCYGYYALHDKPYLKEYTLPSHLYNSDYLQIERIYDLYGEKVIFDRQDFQNVDELEDKLHEIAEVERATDSKLRNNTYGPQEPEDPETIKKHLHWIAKIPSPTTPSDYETPPNPFQKVDDNPSSTSLSNNEDGS